MKKGEENEDSNYNGPKVIPSMKIKIKEPKRYKLKLKRLDDAILSLHSPQGVKGDILIACSADNQVTIYNLARSKL